MGYHAYGGGQFRLKDGVKIPTEIIAELAQNFSEVADSPDGGVWISHEYGKYHGDEIKESMNHIAPFIKEGNVEFSGDDGEWWRFHFYNGKMQEQRGRIVYESVNYEERREYIREMIMDIVEQFEKLLEEKCIEIPNDDDDGEDREPWEIYGCDYADLEDGIIEVLEKYELIEEGK